MNKINWSVRLKNKKLLACFSPSVGTTCASIANIFNLTLEFGDTVDKILVFINVLFAFLVLIGIVNDPTTAGLSDSERALTYTEPNED